VYYYLNQATGASKP